MTRLAPHDSSAHGHQIRECAEPSCRFRFPVAKGLVIDDRCPRCGSAVRIVVDFTFVNVASNAERQVIPHVEALLDNIRSVYNVGSMFRTADGAGMRRLHLCGITTTPDHPGVMKTALGAESAVPWTYHTNGLEAARRARNAGFRLWAIESNEQARTIHATEPYLAVEGPPTMIVVGNEICGIDPEILACCDHVLSLPMQGLKHSLNVAVAFGIAAYFFLHFAATKAT